MVCRAWTGFGSALLGKEAAMACTVAVEEVIGEHYNDQIRLLLDQGYTDVELKEVGAGRGGGRSPLSR